MPNTSFLVSRIEPTRSEKLTTTRTKSQRYILFLSPRFTRPDSLLQGFRQCQSLIQRIGSESTSHTFPPSHAGAQASKYNLQTAKNVQRGLAAKVQELSATFRKKQRVYMESKYLFRCACIPPATFLAASSRA